MNRTIVMAVLILAVMSGFSTAGAQMRGYISKRANPDTAEHVSIIQLIANPERYEGKRVQLVGFLRLEFEGNAVYLHREDYERGIPWNALLVHLPTGITKQEAEAVNMQYVICLGTFDAAQHGHMGLFGGEIKDVQRLQVWPGHALAGQVSSEYEQPQK